MTAARPLRRIWTCHLPARLRMEANAEPRRVPYACQRRSRCSCGLWWGRVSPCGPFGILVGVAGFEPATPTSRTWCATRLRYTPTGGRSYNSGTLKRKLE